MIVKPNLHLTLGVIHKFVSDENVLSYYLGISTIPYKMKSPFRNDTNASLNWYYSKTTGELLYNDCGTNEGGNIYHYLSRLWGVRFNDVLNQVYNDLSEISTCVATKAVTHETSRSNRCSGTTIKVNTRLINDTDRNYWGLYGVDADKLYKYDIYPIDFYWLIGKNFEKPYKAEKLSYAYVERKRNKVTYKIYQPLSKTAKWLSCMDKKTLGLWRFLPNEGNIVCVCSSVKDALTLYTHTNIPAFALQGEAMGLSNTVINELPKRFKRVCIMLDNDEPGIKDSIKLANATGFENIIMPDRYMCSSPFKDIADARKVLGDTQFTNFITNLFYGINKKLY